MTHPDLEPRVPLGEAARLLGVAHRTLLNHAHSVKALRCGKRLEKLPIVLAELQRMLIGFLTVVQAAHVATLEADALDALPQPTRRGAQRVAGVDIQKLAPARGHAGALALASAPRGIHRGRACSQVLGAPPGPGTPSDTARHAAYDPRKLRGKVFAERVAIYRRHRPHPRHPHAGGAVQLEGKGHQTGPGRCGPPRAWPATETHPPLGARTTRICNARVAPHSLTRLAWLRDRLTNMFVSSTRQEV